VWTALLQEIKEIGASWSIFTTLGSFLLYVLGYFVLRFQLATWGVVTDLSVLDERYFFAGARFLVYLVSSVVSVLLLASPLFLIWWLLNKSLRFQNWRKSLNYALAGVIFSVLFVQLIERKCFQLMRGLLVQQQLEGDNWLKATILDRSASYESLFFAMLIMGVALSGWLLRQAKLNSPRRPFAEGLLTLLVAVEILLLPINYGIVVSTRELPKVSQFAPAEAWLVWEGKEKTTFLVLDKERKLVSISNSEVKKLEITGIDQIFRRIFPDNTH